MRCSPTVQDKEAIAQSGDWLKQGAAGGLQADLDTVGNNVSKMFSMVGSGVRWQLLRWRNQLIGYSMPSQPTNNLKISSYPANQLPHV